MYVLMEHLDVFVLVVVVALIAVGFNWVTEKILGGNK